MEITAEELVVQEFVRMATVISLVNVHIEREQMHDSMEIPEREPRVIICLYSS